MSAAALTRSWISPSFVFRSSNAGGAVTPRIVCVGVIRSRRPREVQHLHGDPVVARQGAGAALRRGSGADPERRPARVRRICGDRAFLLPEVLGVARKSTRLNSSHITISYAV